MSVESDRNKAMVRAFIEAIDRKDLDAAMQYAADDYVWQGNAPEGQTVVRGKENVRRSIEEFLVAMPDLKVDILDMVAEGDKVAIRLREVGHHTGATWLGVKPAGARVEWYPFDFYRIENGKIEEEWFTDDPYAILKCLGVTSIA